MREEAKEGWIKENSLKREGEKRRARRMAEREVTKERDRIRGSSMDEREFTMEKGAEIRRERGMIEVLLRSEEEGFI